MTDDQPIDENAVVAEIAKAMEAEGLAESATVAPVKLEGVNEWTKDKRDEYVDLLKQMPPATTGAHDGLYSPIPLDDLRARLEACVAAGVTSYRDGPLELKFDVGARRAIKQPAGEITSF